MGTTIGALVGSANAGKSSVVNSLIGARWAGVSHKPQTTRKRFTGLWTGADQNQVVLYDTPGLTDRTGVLYERMRDEVTDAIKDADWVAFVVRPSEWIRTEQSLKETFQVFEGKIDFLLVNQDMPNFILPSWLQSFPFLVINPYLPTSVYGVRLALETLAPDGACLYDTQMVALQNVRDLVVELGRAVLLDQLEQEIPYECNLEVRQFDENARLIHIDLLINRASHKPIVIGHGGSKLGQIRHQLNQRIHQVMPGYQVKIFVRVEAGWVQRAERSHR